MHSRRFFLTLMAFLLCSLAGRAGAAKSSLFKHVWGDVIVTTETSEEGKALTPPSPQRPVYYKGRSLGQRLGSIGGDREPDVKQLNQFVAQILAKQGYIGVAPTAPDPELYIVLQWGHLKGRQLPPGYPGRAQDENLLWFLGYNPADDIAAPVFPGWNGAEYFRRGMRSPLIETILSNAEESIYGIIVTAFDPKTINTAEPVIYWQTRIGIPARGKSMAAALPVILAAAGPAIGRPADQPVLVSADEVRDGQVNLGELKFLDFEGASPSPRQADESH